MIRFEVIKEAEGWLVMGDGLPFKLSEATQEQLADLRARGHPGIVVKQVKQEKEDKKGGATK